MRSLHQMNPRFLSLALVTMLGFCPLRGHAQQMVIHFRNDRTSPVELFWIDENWAEVFYGTVLPGSLYDQPAARGNVWRIRSGGELIHEYAPSDAPVQPVVISDTTGSRPVPAMAPPGGTAGPVPVPQAKAGDEGTQNLLNQPINFQMPDLASIAQALLAETNRARAEHGLVPLQYSPELGNAAQMHANDMVSLSFFSHENPHDPAKTTVPQRVALCGFPKPGGVLENIATNFGIQYEPDTPLQIDGQGGLTDEQGNPVPPHTPVTLGVALLKQWMNSPGHRNNILSGQTLFGFGVTFFAETGPYSMVSVRAVQLNGNAGSN